MPKKIFLLTENQLLNLTEFELNVDNYLGRGGEGEVSSLSEKGKYVIKKISSNNINDFTFASEQYLKLKKIHHPHINSPLIVKIDPENLAIEIAFKRMYPLSEEDFNKITRKIVKRYSILDLIYYSTTAINGSAHQLNFRKMLLKSLRDSYFSEKILKNIKGILDATHFLLNKMKLDYVDVHDGNIMQDENGIWKLIDV